MSGKVVHLITSQYGPKQAAGKFDNFSGYADETQRKICCPSEVHFSALMLTRLPPAPLFRAWISGLRRLTNICGFVC